MKMSTVFRYIAHRYPRQFKTFCLYLGGGVYGALSWFWMNHFRGSLMEHLPFVWAILLLIGAMVSRSLPRFMTKLKTLTADFKKFKKGMEE